MNDKSPAKRDRFKHSVCDVPGSTIRHFSIGMFDRLLKATHANAHTLPMSNCEEMQIKHTHASLKNLWSLV